MVFRNTISTFARLGFEVGPHEVADVDKADEKRADLRIDVLPSLHPIDTAH